MPLANMKAQAAADQETTERHMVNMHNDDTPPHLDEDGLPIEASQAIYPTPLSTNNNHLDEDEFDWNEDPAADQPQIKRRKTARQLLQLIACRPSCCWRYLSPFSKRLILALVGSIVFSTPAICVNLLMAVPSEEERTLPDFKNMRSNLQCWLYWTAFQWHIGWVTTVFVEIIPAVVSMWTKLFKGRRSERVKSAMEVTRATLDVAPYHLLTIFPSGVYISTWPMLDLLVYIKSII